MMSPVCYSRSLFSLFFAVSPLFSARCFSLLFWRCGHQKPGFLRRREGSPLYFSSIISEISERRHRQRPELSSCSCLFTASGLQEFQSLAPDLFSPRARTRANASPRKSASPRTRTSRAAEVVPASWTPCFRGGDGGEEGEPICQTRTTRQRMPDGKPSNFGRSAAPVWRLAQLICHAYHKQLTVLS
jgi:hypothetical protein